MARDHETTGYAVYSCDSDTLAVPDGKSVFARREDAESQREVLSMDHDGAFEVVRLAEIAAVETHSSVETCRKAERFVDNVVATHFDRRAYNVSVECPACFRTFVYHYEREGVFDNHEERYADTEAPVDASVAEDWNPDAGYYAGPTFNVPAAATDRYELVYVLSSQRPVHVPEQ